MAATPTARKRPAPDSACPAEAGEKRARYQFDSIDDYEQLEEGTFGAVAKARDCRTGETVAVKRIRRVGDDDDGAPNLRALVREAGCLAACRGHPSIVQIRSVATDKASRDLFLIMDFVGPTLRSQLTRPFSEAETRGFMRQLLGAAEKLHATRTIHRDINPDNILVGPDGALKICDFGCATPEKPNGKLYTEESVGTLQYRSPEQLTGLIYKYYGTAVDIWALGCVMAELLTGAPLFTADTEDDVLTQAVDLRDDIVTMGVEAFDGMMELSLPGRELLAGLLSFDECERLTAADALKHPWFAEEPQVPAAAKAEDPGFVPLFPEAQ